MMHEQADQDSLPHTLQYIDDANIPKNRSMQPLSPLMKRLRNIREIRQVQEVHTWKLGPDTQIRTIVHPTNRISNDDNDNAHDNERNNIPSRPSLLNSLSYRPPITASARSPEVSATTVPSPVFVIPDKDQKHPSRCNMTICLIFTIFGCMGIAIGFVGILALLRAQTAYNLASGYSSQIAHTVPMTIHVIVSGAAANTTVLPMNATYTRVFVQVLSNYDNQTNGTNHQDYYRK